MKPNDLCDFRILLVEDEKFIRSTIRRMLRSIGAPDICEAGDGMEALRVLGEGFIPDLIFCDVQMAPMDGAAFLKTVRASSDPLVANIKVIILTAAADVNVVRAFTGLGISSYLLKPVSPKQLADHVNASRASAL